MPCLRTNAVPALLGLALAAGAAAPAAAQDPYADAVIRYLVGSPAPLPLFQNTLAALGGPLAATYNPPIVTLGSGGLIELAFVDNLLTNGGSAAVDLRVYEAGADVEDTFVALRPTAATLALLGPGLDANADGFIEIGKVFGATSSIDIDAIFPAFGAGVLRFDAIQLIDDPNEGDAFGDTPGADINAVEAFFSVAAPPAVVPEPATIALLGTGLVGVLAVGRRRLAPRRADRRGAEKP